jgi:hypothetical protein
LRPCAALPGRLQIFQAKVPPPPRIRSGVSRKHHSPAEVPTHKGGLVAGRNRVGDPLMHDMAAASLIKRVGKAGRRFMAEVAVSTMATLCVTLVLSGWLHQQQGPIPAALIPEAASAAASPQAIETSGERKAEPDARSATAPSDKLALTTVMEPASAAPVRGQQPRRPRARAHDAKPSCGSSCAGRASASADNSPPSSRQAMLDLGPPAMATTIVASPRSPYDLDAPVPPLPIPGTVSRPARPLLEGAMAVADVLSGLARRW